MKKLVCEMSKIIWITVLFVALAVIFSFSQEEENLRGSLWEKCPNGCFGDENNVEEE